MLRYRTVPILSLAGALAAVSGATMAQTPAAPPTEAALTAQGAKRLGAGDFTNRYVGNTLTGTTSDGEAFHVFIESGTAYRMLYQGQRSADRWSVGKDGEFCATAGSETSCTREYLHRDVVHSFNPDGSLAGTARIRSGNPEKL